MKIMGLKEISSFPTRSLPSFRANVNKTPLAPMKRFQRQVRLPQLPENPRGAFRALLNRQSIFHSHRGKTFEKLDNTRAAISAYEKAKYYKPSDVSLAKQVQNLRLERLQNLKA